MINLRDCINWVNKNLFEKICLQISDDFIENSAKIVTELQKNTKSSIFFVGNTLYENCCTDKLSAIHVQADAFIHIGFTCLNCENHLPTFHVFPEQPFDLDVFDEEFSKYFQNIQEKILIFYDLSFTYIIETIQERLQTKYEHVIISKVNCLSNVQFKTQAISHNSNSILGRHYELPKDDQLENYSGLFIGSNNKTLMILALSIPVKKWFHIDNMKFYEFNISKSLWLKKRNFLIEKIRDAKIFGLIIASLNIEEYLKITEKLKHVLKKMRKKIYLFSAGKINPVKLANFQEVDVFVLISCPENSLIESKDYLKPIVTPFDIELAFHVARNSMIPYAIDYKQILSKEKRVELFRIDSQTDISLLSGRIRQFVLKDSTNEDVKSIQLNSSTEKRKNNQIYTIDSQLRRWNGLDNTFHKNSIHLAVEGRDGLPTNYINEC